MYRERCQILSEQIGRGKNAPQPHYVDRAVYYSTFPIQDQVVKGRWNYKTTPVYVVSLLDGIVCLRGSGEGISCA